MNIKDIARWQNVLQKVTLFAQISPEQMESLFTCLRPDIREYSRSSLVAASGDKLRGIGVVLHGQIAVVKDTAAGDRVVMNVLRPGEIFAELAAFSSSGTAPADIVAKSDSVVMFIPISYLTGTCRNSCGHHRQLTVNTMRLLAGKAIRLMKQIDYLTVRGMRAKICSLLADRYAEAGAAEFTLPFDRAEMAEYLGVSRPSLSRELGRLRDEGVIVFRGSRFRVADRAALAKFAAG